MRNITKRLPWLVLLLGGIATIWGALYVRQQIQREADNRFRVQVHDFETTLVRRLKSYEGILFGVVGLYQTSSTVTPEMFRSYAASLNMRERYPALSVINYARVIRANERDQFIRAFHADVGPRAKNVISPVLSEHADEFMVITRSYPPHAPGIGVELFGNLRRVENDLLVSAAMRSAAYQPFRPVGSGMPIRPPGKTEPALAIRLGAYAPSSDGELRLIGTAGIGFALHVLLQEALPASLKDQTHYRIETVGRTGGKTFDPPVPLFDSKDRRPQKAIARHADVMRASFDIEFGGALLRTHVIEQESRLISGRDRILPAVIMAMGFILFGAVAWVSRRLLTANSRLESAVTERTSELRRELDRTRELEREVARIAEEERRRIGQELHDNLGQQLTGMSLSARALSLMLPSGMSELSPHFEALEQATAQAISDVRGLAHGLMPVEPVPSGLRDALMHMAENSSHPSGVQCTFDFDDPVDIRDDDVAAHLYRIAQEALNNALRHSKARHIAIRLDYVDDKVVMSVTDDGAGFELKDIDQSGRGRQGAGLRIMRHRASVINYRLKIESAPGRGTTLRAVECGSVASLTIA